VTAIEAAVTWPPPLLTIALPLLESTTMPHAAFTDALPDVLNEWVADGSRA